MIKILLPLLIIVVICLTINVLHKRESKGAKAKRLEAENTRLKALIDTLDTDARAEYAVNDNNTFAWNVTDKIIDYNKKEK